MPEQERSAAAPEDGAGTRLPGDDAADREAEAAHGGSMAPGLVDATGHPVADPPPTADPS